MRFVWVYGFLLLLLVGWFDCLVGSCFVVIGGLG